MVHHSKPDVRHRQQLNRVVNGRCTNSEQDGDGKDQQGFERILMSRHGPCAPPFKPSLLFTGMVVIVAPCLVHGDRHRNFGEIGQQRRSDQANYQYRQRIVLWCDVLTYVVSRPASHKTRMSPMS